MTFKKKPFENIVGKGENTGNQRFRLFPQCFLSFPQKISVFLSHQILSSANAFRLEQPKNMSFGKGLTLYNTILTFNDPKEEGF